MFLLTYRNARHTLWLALFSLTLSGCWSRPPTAERTWLDFTDQVFYQGGNVTTDLISAPRQFGLENLGYGWRQVHANDPARAAFEMDVAASRLFFFSADGDTTALDIEVSAVGKGRLKQIPLTLVLNDRRLTNLPLTRQWERHRAELPGNVVRKGRNWLELRIPRPKRSQKSRHRLRPKVRSLNLYAANGRPAWPQRPPSITLDRNPPSTSDRSSIRMPSPGWLEAVTDLPERARLRARFQVDRPPGAGQEPVLVYARLLDPELGEHHLAQERVTSSRRAHDFDVDLSGWQGQTVRLQLGVSGLGNAVVSWHWAVIEGRPEPSRPPDIEPIRQLQAPLSGRLGRPDVLVILLDAARADSFSPFGGARPTPNTARLASEGTVFQEATAASSWTGQSMSSIFTGLFPDSLRVGPWGSPLPSDISTAAELLSQVGYRTVLWTQHPFYDHQKDLKRGFQEFYRPAFRDYSSLPSQEKLISEDQPTFAFVHLIPPHTPYTPPPPYRGSYSSWYSGSIEPEASFLSSFPGRRDPEELSDADRRFIRDRYDENIAFADAQVGKLLSMLDSAGRFEDTLVILLSDHGEAFLEHDNFLHSRLLHREFLHVPLVIKWPHGITGHKAEVDAPISLVDLVPTLVDGLALPDQRGGFQGRSLIPMVFESASREPLLWATTRRVGSYQQPPRPRQMLQVGPWKIIHDPLADTSLLYQVETDPAEVQDLSEGLPMRTLLLRQVLQRQAIFNRELLREEPGRGPIEDSDAEIQEQLEALGYLD